MSEEQNYLTSKPTGSYKILEVKRTHRFDRGLLVLNDGTTVEMQPGDMIRMNPQNGNTYVVGPDGVVSITAQ